MLEIPESSAQRSRRVTVYYDRGETVVTDLYVHTAHGRFALAELGELRRSVPYRHRGETVAVLVAGLELALATPFALAYHSLTAFGIAVVVALVVGAGAVRDGRRHPRWFVIEARFRGRDVTVFSTRDESEFQRVRLALVRARDARRAASY